MWTLAGMILCTDDNDDDVVDVVVDDDRFPRDSAISGKDDCIS